MEKLRVVLEQPEDELVLLANDWRISLRARGLSVHTIEAYLDAVNCYIRFTEQTGSPTRARELTPNNIKTFMTHELARGAASSANVRYRGLHTFMELVGHRGRDRWVSDADDAAAEGSHEADAVRSGGQGSCIAPGLRRDHVR